MNGKIKLIKSFEENELSKLTAELNAFAKEYPNDSLEIQYQVHRSQMTYHCALVIVREN